MAGITPIAAVYGFIGWVLTLLAFFTYLLWAIIPDSLLESYGITYYPDKYWALAGPSVFLSLAMFYWVYYVTMYLRNTVALDDVRAIGPWPTSKVIVSTTALTPTRGQSPVVPMKGGGQATTGGGVKQTFGTLSRSAKGTSIPPVIEIPIDVVNKILFSEE